MAIQRRLSDRLAAIRPAASERVPSDPLDLLPNDEASRVLSFSPLARLRARALGNHKSFDERLGTEEGYSGVSVACPSWKTLGVAREAQHTFPGPVTHALENAGSVCHGEAEIVGDTP